MKRAGLRSICLIGFFLAGCAPSIHLLRANDAEILRLPERPGIVLINFWATWCLPCREEIPQLNDLLQEFPQAHFVGVCMDEPENEGAIPGFLKRYPMSYSVLLRNGSEFQKLAQSFDPEWKQGLPATFLFKDGQRIYSRIGILDSLELERVLKDAVTSN